MGKAKKSETTSSAKNLAAVKKPAAKSKSAAPTGAPMIDTNLAAQNAARALVAGLGKTGTAATQPESAMFKQMKADLNKPQVGSNSHLLTPMTGNLGQQKNNTHQKNQGTSYHANVSNTGVPRRNPG